MKRATPRRQASSAAARTAEDATVGPSLTKDYSLAHNRREAAARSVQLSQLFDSLTAAGSKERQRTKSRKDFTSNFIDGGGEDHRSVTLLSREPPLSTSAHPDRLEHGACSSTGGLMLRSSGEAAPPTNIHGLPHPFQEQIATVRSVDIMATEMQRTLEQLHQDLVFHANRRTDAERESGGQLASGPRARQSSNTESSTSVRSDTTDWQRRCITASDTFSEAARIQRARAAAADEGLSDDQSVEDYGVDCEVPKLTSDSCLVDQVEAIAVCMAKMKESAKVMCDTEAAAPGTSAVPWWSSALRMRDMKASAARLDYHAHAALNWSKRSREQLLLQAVKLNNISVSTRSQLLEQQEHRQEFQTRLGNDQQTVTQLQADIARYQACVQTEMARRSALQEELLFCAQERGLVDPEERNPLKAELALLLSEREWPSPTLKKDASVVLGWLRSTSTTLE
ncbi:hypothetical protein, conserved [Leishmania tarentolae]|uniref:Uncharacterized protein n=1 Tax=Leishmania tarentolae TaxID=5689 RepID=A0A640KKX7_LEITA|nr:hypothetical protein, conserved [Leishmania tarentolae]